MGRFDALTQLEEHPAPVKKKGPAGVSVKEQSASLRTPTHSPPPLSEKSVVQEAQDTDDKQRGTPYPAPPLETNKRPVKPRHGFDIYWDQYEALVKWSNEEKLQGGTGSMSAMAREALDDYIAKRKRK
jgi:hypothetical protein